MRVLIPSPGSIGNVILVESHGTRVCSSTRGRGPKVLNERLRGLGVDLPRSVDAVIVTHHHGDHVAHVEPLARALRAPL